MWCGGGAVAPCSVARSTGAPSSQWKSSQFNENANVDFTPAPSPLHRRGLRTGSLSPRPEDARNSQLTQAHLRPAGGLLESGTPPPRPPKLPNFPGALHPSLAQRLPKVGWTRAEAGAGL